MENKVIKNILMVILKNYGFYATIYIVSEIRNSTEFDYI